MAELALGKPLIPIQYIKSDPEGGDNDPFLDISDQHGKNHGNISGENQYFSTKNVKN